MAFFSSYRPQPLLLASVLAATVIARPATAVGQSKEVVQERRYDVDGRLDVSILGGLTVNNKLTDQYALVVQPAYQFADALAVEVTGGYVVAREKTALTNGIRLSAAQNDLRDEFSDMGTMSWIAHAGLRWSPVYGKLSLSSVIPIHLAAYASLGGGLIGTERRSMVGCTNVQDTDGDGVADSHDCNLRAETRASANTAFGLRFYVADWLAFRTEMRAFAFGDTHTVNIDLASQRQVRGVTMALTLLGGASFYF